MTIVAPVSQSSASSCLSPGCNLWEGNRGGMGELEWHGKVGAIGEVKDIGCRTGYDLMMHDSLVAAAAAPAAVP